MTNRTPNLRDVGGVSTPHGTVRSGRLLRSALPLPGDVPPEGLTWPPKVVIDLRSEFEREPIHALADEADTVLNYPLLSALAPGQARPGTLARLYEHILSTTHGLLIDVVRSVAAAEGASLIHCAAGKDRTGVSVALCLSLVGANRDEIVDDYLVTATHEAEIQARFDQIYGYRRASLPNAYFATPVEAITTVLDAWESHEGGATGWFLSHGGDKKTVESLQQSLLQ